PSWPRPLTLDPKPGERVLDLCAAPGGKTTYLAEIMNDKGRIVAVDRKAPRLQKVEEACERLGLTCVETVVADGRDMANFPRELYDRILLDAPCSNTGVLRRRPEARWRYQAKEQKRFIRDQQGLIRLAASRLKNGGTMLYSVCSIEAEEGSGIVQWLLSGAAGRLVLRQETLHLPSLTGGDGGYQALLQKVSE
ncbi:MAG: RsmB/NOP family class I SAM-dependent RNA methyltransferase, partial [Planctomycetota bacterium]|nr:RsmB/NOP family class I SAM-dependent RNA methyltransferase [Planctomycetota bacterium]